MRHPDATRADLERLARWLIVESEELQPFIPEALDLVQATARAPFWNQARASAEAHVEVPFAIRARDAKPGVPALLFGAIDLVYRAGEGWKIVDYKTDRGADDEAFRQRHGLQLVEYRTAWERITGEKVQSAELVRVR